MFAVEHAIAFLLGVAIVIATWQSVIVTIILPRRTRNWIGLSGWIATYVVITAVARRIRDPVRKDTILALLAPLNIVGLLFTWMVLFAIGFGFVMWATGAASFPDSFDLAGSSIFTLGFAVGKTPLSHFLMDASAASGMIVVGLQIGYLPTIYGAYSQREALVTLLTMRAAENHVVTGATVLLNHPLPISADLLKSLFTSWETAAAAIVESHSNYPWLIVFRSPRRTESWVTSMLAILDAIALLEALAPSRVPIEASHCRFACSASLRVLSDLLVHYVGNDLEERAPLSFETFATEVAALTSSIPLERDSREAWPLFCQSRADYERSALKLGAYIDLDVPTSSWLRPVGPPESPVTLLSPL